MRALTVAPGTANSARLEDVPEPPVSDGVVLVLEANSTRRVAARKAQQAVEAANVRVLGTVLNNRTFPIPEKIYRLL